MHKIAEFNFDDTTPVRTIIGENGEPWFVAKDICNILGYQNPSKTLSDHLESDERSNVSLGRQGETNIISESGLYTLIIRSNKPQAKQFRRWVTGEVLPAIRKTGRYSLGGSAARLDVDSLRAGYQQTSFVFKEFSVSVKMAALTGRKGDERLVYAGELTFMRIGVDPLEYFHIELPEGEAVRGDAAVVSDFVRNCCDLHGDVRIPKKTLFASYKRYCRDSGEEQVD